MLEEINKLRDDFLLRIDAITSIKELEEIRIKIFGKKGEFARFSSAFKTIPIDQKSQYGKTLNGFKTVLGEKLEKKTTALESQGRNADLEKEWMDVTVDMDSSELGSLHPISTTQYELEDLFSAMGFKIMDGPQIDSEYYNFEALNIPKEHPARDMQDTFFFPNGEVLRTQTSTLQIRAMELYSPPLRIIGAGKVFRAENIDATHECCFHQLEGMVVDKGISVANLKYFIQEMLSKLFDTEVKIRLRPGYFPFVEPGYEVELGCLFCDQKGCRICKHVGWIELLGCGMTHPHVLKNGGIDPDVYSGFAFGMGIDRLAMSKYGINDIRFFHTPDLRFHNNFS